jgi:hypothetical protein
VAVIGVENRYTTLERSINLTRVHLCPYDLNEAGTSKEPYLLILTPARSLKFFNVGGTRQRLLDVLASILVIAGERSADFWKVRDYYALARDTRQNYFLRRVLLHEAVNQPTVTKLLRLCLDDAVDFVDLGHPQIEAFVERANLIRGVLESAAAPAEQAESIGEILPLIEPEALASDLEAVPIGKLPGPEEDPSRLGQVEIVGAVQLETIVGAKGMSADHVLVLGCDETNMNHITRNAFFVALTRARQSLTLLACMEGGGAENLHPFVRVLPDNHTRTTYLTSKGATPMETVDALVDHLGEWHTPKLAEGRSPRRRRVSGGGLSCGSPP